jgi:PTS system ascorbate-specific IIA component
MRGERSMAQIVIVAHAPLASSLQAVAQHVYPDAGQRLTAVDVPAGAGLDEVERSLREALAPMLERGDEVLLLVDVFGATPCNAALAAVDGPRARIVAGVNVPMLWRTLCYASMPLDDLMARAVAGASQGVMHVAVPRRQNQAPLASSHDPVQHHHQQ